MNQKILLVVASLCSFFTVVNPVFAQGTAFTYQGRLNNASAPANGSYDLRFIVYDNSVGGSQQGPILTNSPTAVSNGLFTVTLDFGSQFPGAGRWLEIAVRTNGASSFFTLSPRQALTPVPYATLAYAANSLAVVNGQQVNLAVNGTNVLRLTLVNDPSRGITANSVGGSPANVISNGVYGGFIGGGGSALYPNRVGADYASVLGGLNNTASGITSTAMGYNTTASGPGSTAIGISVTASGHNSTAIGYNTTASGDYSLAAGQQAQAIHQGSFVWSDYEPGDFTSTGVDQFLIRAQGGVGIGLNNPSGALHVASASGNPQFQITQNTSSDYARLRMNVTGQQSWEMDVSPGATPAISWWNSTLRMNLDYNGNLTTTGTVNGTSDRNAKEKFTAVSSREVLDKVAALPITEWNFKNESQIRHLGPMAQDFYAAFNVGMDDKHIATVDEGGVALAAIQGLNQKLADKAAAIAEQNARIQTQAAEIQQLQQSVAKLQALVSQMAKSQAK